MLERENNMKKVIIFNALQTTLSGGIGRYSYELVRELYNIYGGNIKIVVRQEDITLFNFAKNEDLFIIKGIKNSKMRNLYEQFVLPFKINKKYPDAIVHYPDTMAPLLAKNKVVITIHDLAFKSLSNVFTKRTVFWKNIITDLSIKKASKIIAITEFTKSEIIKHYPTLDNNKIHVVYNGFNDFTREQINLDLVNDNILNLNNKYILTVSTISPRKNIDTLIKVFSKIKNQISHNLVIAGANGWLYEDVYKLVDELDLKNRVIFTGKINDEELKYLYKNCSLFTYLSIYEGFGLPPLEALSYGINCIVSNTSSIPEVVGNNAIKVNPFDENLIEQSIIKEIIKPTNINASDWLKNFSWVKCARDTYAIY